jgi:hypothetical protein
VRRLRRLRAAALAACAAGAAGVAGAATLIGCAAPGMPPGGPVDQSPPSLLGVIPDTGTLNARLREVLFRFDEVLSERPRAAQSLEQIVVVSPSDGPVTVDWRRQSLAIRPRRGWRANTAYTVTILPGLSDLRGNVTKKPLQTEFSTGSVIPGGAVRGVVFDWVGQRVASGARIEAMSGADTMLKYIAAADTAGRFALTNLPPGSLLVRAYVDQNSNRVLDRREAWDSTRVGLADSARYDFYVFAHDSVGPYPSVTPVDSVTLRVKFNRPLLPLVRLDTSQFVLRRRSDSARTLVRRALSAPAYDSLAAMRAKVVADSVAKADTTAAGRAARARADSLRAAAARDSVSRAQIAAIREARDTTRRETLPKPARPAPFSEYVLELAAPLVSGTWMRLEARDVTGLAGAMRTSQVDVLWKRPERRDSTATKAPPPKKP